MEEPFIDPAIAGRGPRFASERLVPDRARVHQAVEAITQRDARKEKNAVKKLLIALVSTLALVIAPISLAEPTTVVRTTLSGEYVNECTGETVLTSGTSILLFRGSFDGAYPLFERAVFVGTALGATTGTVYRVTIAAMDPGVTNVTAGGVAESTDVLNYHFVSPGGEQDLFLHIAHHTTVNDAGEVVSNPVVVKAQCLQ